MTRIHRFLPFLTLSAALAAGCQDYGYSGVEYSTSFVQEDVDTYADVLFVVDDSPSMAEEQERLEENFEAFVEAVEGTYADYHAGVVTTDVTTDSAGTLRGGIITPDTEDLADTFLEALQVGSYGSRDERGFEATVLALEPDRNPDFIRSGAELDVVYISDEDDHSSGEMGSWLEAMRQGSGNGEVVVHAIVGNMPAGCASGVTAADPGERYLDIAESTEGYEASICGESYEEILTRIGLDLSGLQDTFVLDDLPQPDTLEVYVDEVLIPERAEDGWSYDASENAIIFEGYAVPRPGMAVVVYYKVLPGAVGGSDDTGAG